MEAHAVLSARGPLLASQLWTPRRFNPCPLCAWGEAGAQHLIVWCPAATMAWRAWGGGGAHPLVETILDPGDNAGGLAIFLQQVSFLHCSLLGRTALGVEEAASKIRRACDRGNTRSMWDEGGSDSEEEPSELSGEEVRDSWTSLPIAPTCPQCGGMGSVHHCVQASVEPAMQAMPRGGGEVTLRPVCTEAVQPGTLLALCLQTRQSRVGWPRVGNGGLDRAATVWRRRGPGGRSVSAPVAGRLGPPC